MHKIKKFQYGTGQYGMPQYNVANQFFKDTTKDFNKILQQPLPKFNFKTGTFGSNLQINAPQSTSLGNNLLTSATKGTSGSGFLSGLGGMKGKGGDLVGMGSDLLGAGLEAAGVKRAETMGGGEELAMQGLDTVGKTLIKAGGPLAVAGGVMLGAKLLNEYGGEKNKEQGTTGIGASGNLGGYTEDLSTSAGKKNSMWGTYGPAVLFGGAGVLGSQVSRKLFGKSIFGKTKQDYTNEATARADRSNLLKSRAGYGTSQNQLAAANTYGDIATRTQQQLGGGVRTNMLSAKNGAKINPKQLSTIKKKAQFKTKIKKLQEGIPTDDLQKMQNGGLFQTNKVAYVDSVLNANKHLDWVKRLYNPTQSIPSPLKKGETSTHLMSYDPGSKRVYPTVVNRNGKLEYLSNPDQAWDYADKTKEYIEFPTAEEAKWFANSTDHTSGYKMGTNVLKTFAKGGQLNVIPEGALHAHKNNYEGELGEQVTSKGIPVITYEEDGKITQHAEIEHSEIIFTKEVTTQLEDWAKQYKETDDKAKKAELEIKCGEFLTHEILENTEDNMGLLE